jgi:hypothetical protein
MEPDGGEDDAIGALDEPTPELGVGPADGALVLRATKSRDAHPYIGDLTAKGRRWRAIEESFRGRVDPTSPERQRKRWHPWPNATGIGHFFGPDQFRLTMSVLGGKADLPVEHRDF